MINCPNCQHQITDEDRVCPNCGFDLQKYREVFFKYAKEADEKASSDKETEKTEFQPKSRAAYRKEIHPDKQNEVIARMISWMRENATIVFLIGLGLMIITSFTVVLGWLLLVVLLIWLYVICQRDGEIEQYTADRRLTEIINKFGSNLFNSFEDHEEKAQEHRTGFINDHPKLQQKFSKIKITKKTRFNYIQASVLLLAAISLLVLFSGTGATITEFANPEKVSLSKVILSVANRLLTTGKAGDALLIYFVWLLLIVFPISIILSTIENTEKSKLHASALSIIETAFLIYIAYRTTHLTGAANGFVASLVKNFSDSILSIGASAYYLILASLMTSILAIWNVFKKSPASKDEAAKKEQK